MKKLIYAVDFDGTLCENKWPDIGEANKDLIKFLLREKSLGHRIILYTMREGQKLDDALKWCRKRGLSFDAVNDNLQEMKAFYGNNPRKVYADWYIDDHNWCIDNHKLMFGSLPYHPGNGEAEWETWNA